jgi:hypothetical protein
MKKLLNHYVIFISIVMLLVIIAILVLPGCAAGSATAAYAVKAGSADEVSNTCRQSIIHDVIEQMRNK